MKKADILSYTPELGESFKSISYTWIEKYFGIEEQDRELLENHQTKIIDQGGYILFAKYEDQIVGACALINHGDGLYELAKMGVMESHQGLGIGRQLAEAIITQAQAVGATKVFLESSQDLTSALALYRKIGFKDDPDFSVKGYSRCNVLWTLELFEQN